MNKPEGRKAQEVAMTTDLIKEVKESLEKITPGEWEVEHDPNEGYLIYHVVNGERVYIMQFSLSSDAEFSASAPTYCRKLIAKVEELEKGRDELAKEYTRGWQDMQRKAIEIFDRVITIEFATHMPENLSILMARKIKVAILAEKERK